MMPNKTIYVAEADQPLFEQAQELAGGNLSAAIAQALRRYVASETVQESGDIVVKVGSQGAYIQKRFKGRLVGKQTVATADHSRMVNYYLYQTPKGNFAVSIRETPNWSRRNWSKNPEDYMGDWCSSTFRLEIYQTLEALQPNIPPELYAVAASGAQTTDGIEDLDI